jgi:hypothetical protein
VWHYMSGRPVCGPCAEARRQYDRERRRRNGEAMREAAAAYRSAHREELRAKGRAYYARKKAERESAAVAVESGGVA